jgi:hypothetical protein
MVGRDAWGGRSVVGSSTGALAILLADVPVLISTPTRGFARDLLLNYDAMRTKKTSKREVIEPHQGDKRYVRRKSAGTFGKTVDVGKSLSADKRTSAKTKVAKGQGDRGDTR